MGSEGELYLMETLAQTKEECKAADRRIQREYALNFALMTVGKSNSKTTAEILEDAERFFEFLNK